MAKGILIADDSQFMRRMIRTCFEDESSFAVCGEAVDGDEAVAMAQELKPDLIVLDFAMPRLNGIEAAQALQPVLPMTPKILFTSYTDVVSEQVARSAGVSAVLSKTDGIDKLMKEIRKLLIAKQCMQDSGLKSSGYISRNQTPRTRPENDPETSIRIIYGASAVSTVGMLTTGLRLSLSCVSCRRLENISFRGRRPSLAGYRS